MKTMRLAYSVFFWLIWRDLRVITKDFWQNLLDVLLLPIGMIFVSGYIMPSLGLPADFGAFMLSASAIGMCFNATGTDAGDLVTDLTGPKSIAYELSLPSLSWLICVKTALVYAIKAAIFNVFIFPLGVLLLGNHGSALGNISLIKTVLIYVSMNIMFGFFSLCIALWVKDVLGFGRFWIRWGWQLFTLAGFQFSWATMYTALPWFAGISLANPLVYTFEGMRAATLGQEGFINIWVCLAMIWVFTLIFALSSLRLFKKRLDCV